MKTLMSYLVVAALILTSSFTINTQKKLNERTTSECFGTLRVHRQAKNVVATWSVTTNNVVSFNIERSYDGEFFETTGSMDYNGTATYKYKDLGVFPGTIYYRITAIKADGTTECSPVESVRIVQRG